MVSFLFVHLRSHISQVSFNGVVKTGACAVFSGRSTLRRARKSKTNNFYRIACVLYHYVIKFQLPVSEATVMDMLQSRKHLSEEVLSDRLSKRLLINELRELVANDSL